MSVLHIKMKNRRCLSNSVVSTEKAHFALSAFLMHIASEILVQNDVQHMHENAVRVRVARLYFKSKEPQGIMFK